MKGDYATESEAYEALPDKVGEHLFQHLAVRPPQLRLSSCIGTVKAGI